MKLTNLFTVTTLTVSILTGCGGGEGDTSQENKSSTSTSSSESVVTASPQVDANDQSSINKTDTKYSKASVIKSSQFNIPTISTKAIRITQQPQRIPVMSVERPAAPKPVMESSPVLNEQVTPDLLSSMTVMTPAAVSPTAQTTPELMPLQTPELSTPQMVSVETPKPVMQSSPVLNTPEPLSSMTVMTPAVVSPTAQTTPELMPLQTSELSTLQMVSVETPKPVMQSSPVLNTPEPLSSMTVVTPAVVSPTAQTTPELMPLQTPELSTPQMVSVETPKPVMQSSPVLNEQVTPELLSSMTVMTPAIVSPTDQTSPKLMPLQTPELSTPQVVSVETPKTVVQLVPAKNEWVVATDASLMSETLDFDSPALIIQEVPKEQPSVSQPSGDIVSDFAIAQVTSEFETAVDNINYLKDIVQSIVDHTGSHGNGHNNGVQTSHITLESGESLTIKVKHDQSIEVTLDQSGHGHSQSAVLIGSLDYEPYTGAYTLIADFQDVSSLGISSAPSISSTIAGTYYNDNFNDIEVRNYNDQFEYGVVYIDEEGNPYMAYATHAGLDINVEYRA